MGVVAAAAALRGRRGAPASPGPRLARRLHAVEVLQLKLLRLRIGAAGRPEEILHVDINGPDDICSW